MKHDDVAGLAALGASVQKFSASIARSVEPLQRSAAAIERTCEPFRRNAAAIERAFEPTRRLARTAATLRAPKAPSRRPMIRTRDHRRARRLASSRSRARSPGRKRPRLPSPVAAARLRPLLLHAVERLHEWVFRFELRPGRRLACVDCGVNTARLGEYYMVWPDVWASSGLRHDDGMLCVGCLEHRLGRRLNAVDFTAVPVNFDRVGPRLRERIFG